MCQEPLLTVITELNTAPWLWDSLNVVRTEDLGSRLQIQVGYIHKRPLIKELRPILEPLGWIVRQGNNTTMLWASKTL